MTVLFLTMSRFLGGSQKGIYSDLMRQFLKGGHDVYVVSPYERSYGKETALVDQDGIHVLGVRTLNLQKTSILEKGFGQILVEGQYKRAIRKYLVGIQFDLVLYSTPPVTFPKVIRYVKRRNPKAKTYLLLKDIFPQNAVDLGMLQKTGVKGILYRFFRKKEKTLYHLSDYIGCMSPANVEYVLRHNPEIEADRVEVAPNSIELDVVWFEPDEKSIIREKYQLPANRPIFIYGGNLGKPQGIPFLIECLDANANRNDCYFIVIGTGTEFSRLMRWYLERNPKSVRVMSGVPKDEYDDLLRACDVGLIFLDHRFTIPNYPSRILSYMKNKMPVLCATDSISDVGRIAEQNGYGYCCESNSIESFTCILDKMIHSDRRIMGERAYEYLCQYYLVEKTYNTIIKHF